MYVWVQCNRAETMAGNLHGFFPSFRSTSVSRGLQVEEQDLIEFSDRQRAYQQLQRQRRIPTTAQPNGNVPNTMGNELIGGTGKEHGVPEGGNRPDAQLKPHVVGHNLDQDQGDVMDEDEDDETASARTADEQMDYLESLEPCPCYAKCICDSIITLFCVTLLG